MELLTDWIIPLLFYSGPVLTFGSVLKFFPTPKRRSIFWQCMTVHALAFLPFVYFAITKHEDFIHALFLPALTGFVTFITGMFYLIFIAVKSLK